MLLLIFLKRRRALHSGSSDMEEREQNPTHTVFANCMRLDNIQNSFFRPGMREGVREGGR